MKSRFLIAVAAATLISTSAFAASSPHWTYEGAEGPAHWADLAKNFEACETGHEQSPSI
ncbi:hypothetical protein V6L77_03855 [Pannonibacter sp. Pt2-lr]